MRGKGKYLRWRGDKAMNTRRGGSSPGLDMGQKLACPHPCPTSYNTLGREQYLVHAKSLPSCRTLCDPKDCSPPGSSVHGILQARILHWVAIPFSRGSSQTRDGTHISCISYTVRQILHQCATWENHSSHRNTDSFRSPQKYFKFF